MKAASLLGWLIFLFAMGHFLGGYGRHWEFGRYGMPSTLLAPDGWHYLDGSEIDPISLSLKRRGVEEDAELVAFLIFVAILLWCFVMMRNQYRRELALVEQELWLECHRQSRRKAPAADHLRPPSG